MFRNTISFRLLAVVLVLVVCWLAGIQAVETWHGSERRVGFSLELVGPGLEVTAVEPGLAADKSGVRLGDVLLSLNGLPIGSFSEYDSAAATLERGRPASLELIRGGRTLDFILVPGEDFPWLWQAVLMLAILAYLAVSLLALLHRSKNPRARLLFLLCAAIAIEVALPRGIGLSPMARSAVLSAFFLLTGLQIGLQLHLASSIPSRLPILERRPWIMPLIYGAGLLLGVVASITMVIDEQFTSVRKHFLSALQVEDLFFDLGVPIWAILTAGILGYQAYRAADTRGRHQAGLVLAGVLPWVVFTLLLALLAAFRLASPEWLDDLEPLVLLCYPVAIFAAIFRHHLFDLGVAVKRSLVATTLTGGVLLFFYSALGAGGAWVSRLFGRERSVLVIALATLVLGLLFSPLKRVLENLIERHFLPERQKLRQSMVALAEDLAEKGHVANMGDYLVTLLQRILVVDSVTLLLSGPHRGSLSVQATTHGDLDREDPSSRFILEKPDLEVLLQGMRPVPANEIFATSSLSQVRPALQRAEYLLPLQCKGKLTGVLVLGAKSEGDRFRDEELELLSLMAHHVAIVFENARLLDSAKIESVTGLLRRETTLDLLSQELRRALRYSRPLTVGLCDLDLFKEINDRFGHLAGDTLLRSVSGAMASALRGSDLLGRYGGDEFLIVLPETDLNGAVTVAEKIRRRVEENRSRTDCGSLAGVTVSIGLASLHRFQVVGRRQATARDLIAAADNALYHAKGQGRNRVSTQTLPRGEQASTDSR